MLYPVSERCWLLSWSCNHEDGKFIADNKSIGSQLVSFERLVLISSHAPFLFIDFLSSKLCVAGTDLVFAS